MPRHYTMRTKQYKQQIKSIGKGITIELTRAPIADYTNERPFLALKKAVVEVLGNYPNGCSIRTLKDRLTADHNFDKRQEYKLNLALETMSGAEIEIDRKCVLIPLYKLLKPQTFEQRRQIELKEAREAKDRRDLLSIYPTHTARIYPHKDQIYKDVI